MRSTLLTAALAASLAAILVVAANAMTGSMDAESTILSLLGLATIAVIGLVCVAASRTDWGIGITKQNE